VVVVGAAYVGIFHIHRYHVLNEIGHRLLEAEPHDQIMFGGWEMPCLLGIAHNPMLKICSSTSHIRSMPVSSRFVAA
jgi:hypothetical protein